MKYDLIIFDLDGTLMDTSKDLGGAVNYALSRKGFGLHTDKEYKQMVGHGVRNLVRQALPPAFGHIENHVDSCLALFMEYYSEHIADFTRPYRGIQKLIEDLNKAGVKLAVASNKFQEGTQRLIDMFFPGIPFVAVYGNREGAPLKPDPALVDQIISICNEGLEEKLTRERVAMVGDSGSDIKTAANAGITGIAVSWGFRSKEELVDSGAENIATTVRELRSMPFLI